MGAGPRDQDRAEGAHATRERGSKCSGGANMSAEPRRPFVVDLWAEWDPDPDPGLRRTRDAEEAFAAGYRAPQPEQEAPRAPQAAEAETTPARGPAPEESRRGRVAELLALVRAGDRSAAE